MAMTETGFPDEKTSPPTHAEKLVEKEQEKVHAQAAAEPGRGREAKAPTEIPKTGWKDIFWRVYAEFSNDRLMLVAAGLTFYLLLALFPAITAFISIYGLFSDLGTVNDHLQAMSGVLPSGAVQIIGEQLERTVTKGDVKLGFGLVFGLGVALWSANAGMKSFFDALNIVYGEKEKRSFVMLTLVSLGFTLALVFFIAIALGTVVIMPIVFDYVGLGGLETILLILRWPVLLAIVAGGISIMFRYGPSRERAKWRWVTPGAGFASLMWIVFSIAFSYYAANFGSYDETYGSLGAAIGFMTWVWLSCIVVLFGAELNAELEHQTAEDTTTSPDKPMGERGAVMADTVGEAVA
jgi:membrane protein